MIRSWFDPLRTSSKGLTERSDDLDGNPYHAITTAGEVLEANIRRPQQQCVVLLFRTTRTAGSPGGTNTRQGTLLIINHSMLPSTTTATFRSTLISRGLKRRDGYLFARGLRAGRTSSVTSWNFATGKRAASASNLLFDGGRDRCGDTNVQRATCGAEQGRDGRVVPARSKGPRVPPSPEPRHGYSVRYGRRCLKDTSYARRSMLQLRNSRRSARAHKR